MYWQNNLQFISWVPALSIDQNECSLFICSSVSNEHFRWCQLSQRCHHVWMKTQQEKMRISRRRNKWCIRWIHIFFSVHSFLTFITLRVFSLLEISVVSLQSNFELRNTYISLIYSFPSVCSNLKFMVLNKKISVENHAQSTHSTYLLGLTSIITAYFNDIDNAIMQIFQWKLLLIIIFMLLLFSLDQKNWNMKMSFWKETIKGNMPVFWISFWCVRSKMSKWVVVVSLI